MTDAGWQGGSGGGGSGKSRRTASADGGDSAQRRPYWLHWALLLLLFAACILTGDLMLAAIATDSQNCSSRLCVCARWGVGGGGASNEWLILRA